MSAFTRTGAASLLALSALAWPAGDAALAEVIGTTAAANIRSAGTPPGGATRVIEIGTQILRNEKIETSKSGSVQLIFIDKTSLTIGPNSSMVIDEFVFNPADATGHAAVTLARGVLRVVGGQASHTGGLSVTTPVATLGIRGGVATVKHCPANAECADKGTRAVNHFGAMTINSGGVAQPVRMGFVAAVGGIGQPPTAPVRVSSQETSSDLAATTSKGGQKGGSAKTPTDALAAQAGLGASNAGANVLTPPKLGTVPNRVGFAATNPSPGVVKLAVQQAATGKLPLPTDDIAGVPGAAFLLTTTAGAGSSVPFLTASFATAGNVSVSPVFGYRDPGSSLAGPNATRIFQANLGISGVGPSQKSFLSVMTGGIFNTGKGVVQVGSFTGTSTVADSFVGSARRIQASGSASSTTNPLAAVSPIGLDASGLPAGSYQTSQNALSVQTGQNFIQTAVNQASDNAASANNPTLYNYSQTVTRGTTPSDLGVNRPTLTLNGYVGGIGATSVRPVNTTSFSNVRSPAYIVTNLTGTPGDVSISLDGTTSRLSAQFNVTASNGTASLGTGIFRFGTPAASGHDDTRGAYVDLTRFAARSERTFSVSNGVATSAETSTVDGQVLKSSDLTLVNANAVNAASFFQATTFCACTYTQWGFWSVATSRSDATHDFFDRTGIATWVAGVPAAASDVQNAITANTQATYAGHAIVTISNNGAQYLAASNFTNTVNFGGKVGLVSIPSLDGVKYSGNVGITGAALAGTLTGVSLSGPTTATSLKLNGAFFQSTTSKIGEMGGNLAITRPSNVNYLGSGIFAASKR